MASSYETLAAPRRFEAAPVKGSRFLASAAPAASAEEAQAFVAQVAAEFPKASHHCWAYRLGAAGERHRCSDDGEPGGSAGRPILQQLEGHALSDLVVVVTRWFGGTKLGVGGLMRAYGGVAGKALDRAPRRTVRVSVPCVLSFPYPCSGTVDALLAAHDLRARRSAYAADVRLELAVPLDALAAFEHELAERTAGRAVLRRQERGGGRAPPAGAS